MYKGFGPQFFGIDNPDLSMADC